MKLTEAQIEELYAFTRKKYVEYYDVQTELVDHLATSIEEKMSTSNINFETALQQIYAQFGIFGFSELVEKKGIEVVSKNRLFFRKSFIEYFKLPKFLLLLMLLVGSYPVFKFASSTFVFYTFIATIGIFGTIIFLKIILIKRNIKMPLLQFKYIFFTLSSFGLPLLLVQYVFYLSLLKLTGFYQIIIPLIFSLIIISYLAEIEVLDKLFNQQKKLYPEAFK